MPRKRPTCRERLPLARAILTSVIAGTARAAATWILDWLDS
ncbi:hypothetical protein T261_8065 [Streptomyces lydicus]|nr:hypothetical protein T261_8065 [Streptomyces lydicus]